ncbi:MAG: hypothetical protein ACRDBL_02770 [Rhabdaerophilum sp.]
MGDFLGSILELLFGNRWVRYAIGGLVLAGTFWGGDFSTSLPWIVLAIIVGWLVLHEIIDRHLKSKRQK